MMLRHTEIGIDLGMHEIKIVKVKEINSSSEGTLSHLEHSRSYKVKSEMYSKEYFHELKRAIVNFSQKIKKRRLSLNFALPVNEHTETLFMTVPLVSEKDLEEGIKFEAEQLLTERSLSDYKSTWKIIEEYAELNEYEVLFATLSSKIMKHFSQFKTINWRINRVMLQPVILEKLARTNDVIVDFGYKSSRIYMYKEGRLTEIETIDSGGFDIDEQVKSHMKDSDTNLSIEEVYERIYVKSDHINPIEETREFNIDELYGESHESTEVHYDTPEADYESTSESLDDILKVIDGDDDSEGDSYSDVEDDSTQKDSDLIEMISDEIKPAIENLMDETKRSIRSFELKNGLNVDEVYYMGELFNLKYLNMKLESELDVDLKNLSIIAKDIEGVKYDLAGLAMLSPKDKDKMDFAKHIRANVDYTSILTAVLAVSLSTSITIGVMNSKYDGMIEEQLAKSSEQTQTITQLDEEMMRLQESINLSERFINKIESLKGQKKWLSDALYVLPDTVPLSVSIDELDIVDRSIAIEGYSADYSSIGFFAEALREHGTVEIDRIDEYKVDEDSKVYSVVTDQPETISDRYLMTKKFKITFNHNGQLLKR